MSFLLASFMSPQNITASPSSLLWALPILFGISIVVKTIKPVNLDVKVMLKEAAALFVTSTVVIALIAVVLGFLLHFVNA